MSTAAEQFAAALGDDGQNFETDNGISFDNLAEQMGATLMYSAREYADDIDNTMTYVDGFESSHISGDPIRYAFPDGSAIVLAGEAWDIEGTDRYSWSC